jgi:hypothetical protein
MLAEKTAHQLRSEGALDPKHLDFHQAMRKLEPHYPFLPRPGEVPAHPSYNEATRPVTSGDIGAIVDAVFNQPRNPANKETLSEIFGYLSAAQKDAVIHRLSPDQRLKVMVRHVRWPIG